MFIDKPRDREVFYKSVTQGVPPEPQVKHAPTKVQLFLTNLLPVLDSLLQ